MKQLSEPSPPRTATTISSESFLSIDIKEHSITRDFEFKNILDHLVLGDDIIDCNVTSFATLEL
jgi:hypothetical protein